MKRTSSIISLLVVALALQGCVVVIGTDADDGAYWAGGDYSVNGVEHDGERLSRNVARLIADDIKLASEDIRVTSDNGVVVLEGRVADIYRLARAVATAESVEGVEHVVSEITVDAG